MRKIKKMLLFPLMCIFALVASGAAKADTYTITTDHCTGGCGVGEGTVTVTQDGTNTVQIDVAGTGTGFVWAVTGAGDYEQFFFNITGNPTISASFTTTGWELVSTTPSFSQPGDGLSDDFEYAVTCDYTGGACDKGGTSSGATPPLVFTVTATGLTPASFDDDGGTSGANTAQFAADIGADGNTGLEGFTLTSSTPPVPEPSSLLLLGTGLAVLAGALKKKLLA